MSNKKYSSEELLLKILQDEFEREKRIGELGEELDRLEHAEIRDAERIDEIVAELRVINPFPGEEDYDIRDIPGKLRRYRRKQFFKPLKVASYCAAFIIMAAVSTQILVYAALDINIWDWTKNTFLYFIGIKVQQDTIDLAASITNKYDTVEEFETEENIKILIPAWLPNDIKVKIIEYSYNYTENKITIIYNSDTTLLTIKLNSDIPNTDGAKIYENENIIFYVFVEANIVWWEYNGDFYNLTCGFDVNEFADEIFKNIK